MLSAVIIFVKNGYLEEVPESHILYFFSIGCYNSMVSAQCEFRSVIHVNTRYNLLFTLADWFVCRNIVRREWKRMLMSHFKDVSTYQP
jgi:hypothetical protein